MDLLIGIWINILRSDGMRKEIIKNKDIIFKTVQSVLEHALSPKLATKYGKMLLYELICLEEVHDSLVLKECSECGYSI